MTGSSASARSARLPLRLNDTRTGRSQFLIAVIRPERSGRGRQRSGTARSLRHATYSSGCRLAGHFVPENLLTGLCGLPPIALARAHGGQQAGCRFGSWASSRAAGVPAGWDSGDRPCGSYPGPRPAVSAATIRLTRCGRSARPAGLVSTRWWTAPIRVKARVWVSVPGEMRPRAFSASR